MALYIQPVVEGVLTVLQKYIAGVLDGTGYPPFVDYGICFTGVLQNVPAVWVMPVRTVIDDEGNNYAEQHLVTIKFAVSATEPDEVANAAMAYMKAISDAIEAAQPADWGAIIPLHAHLAEHDYGPTFQKDGMLAKFPEAHLEVMTQEVIA